MFILSPLEQFQIISLFSVKFGKLDFSITNALLISLISLIFFNSIIYFLSFNKNYINKPSFFFVSNSWQNIVELIYDIV